MKTLILLLLTIPTLAQTNKYSWVEKIDYSKLPKTVEIQYKQALYDAIGLNERKQYKALLDSCIDKSATMLKINQMQAKDLNKALSELQVLRYDRDKLQTDRVDLSVDKQKSKDADKYNKPFGISPALIYDYKGQITVGIGVSYTPKFLRFRL